MKEEFNQIKCSHGSSGMWIQTGHGAQKRTGRYYLRECGAIVVLDCVCKTMEQGN